MYPTRLFDPQDFCHVFEPYCGSNVIFYPGPGNVGDRLIYLGTQQLFKHYKITVSKFKPKVSFYGGGGNMGTLYPEPIKARQALSQEANVLKIPIVVLPQTWTGPDNFVANKYWVREKYSLKFIPNAELAPDLGLAYFPIHLKVYQPTKNEGYFFRRDAESVNVPANNICDPATKCDYYDVDRYLKMSWEYKKIHTNRLHFAIGALMAGRDVTLYPNSYFKNRAIYEAWLADKGCKWGEL